MTKIDCPRARTWMTPCIARDGALALDEDLDGTCIGCGIRPRAALVELAERAGPVEAPPRASARTLAELLRRQVSSYMTSRP